MRHATILFYCSLLLSAGPALRAEEPDARILYEKWIPDAEKKYWGEYVEIWSVEPDGSDAERLTSGSYDVGASWSPDRSRIAFSRRGRITVLQLDDKTRVELPVGGKSHDPQWLDDGTLLATAAVGGEDEFSRSWRLVEIDVASGDWTEIEIGALIGVFSPTISPDRSRLAFRAWEDGEVDVFVADLEDLAGTRKALRVGDSYPAQWTPDGRSLLVLRDDASCDVVRPDGKLVDPPVRATECNLTWSSSGDRIVFQKGADLWVSNGNGRKDRLLVEPGDDARLKNPVW